MKKRLMILITGLLSTLFAGYSLASENSMDFHGFVSQGYLSTTENNFISDSKKGTFEFSEAGINFSKDVTEKLWAGIQLFTRNFGNNDEHGVKIDWAFADYRFQDWLGLRFGQLKTPHGLYNEVRDIDMIRTSVLMPQSVYPEVMRDVNLSLQGAGIHGDIDLNKVGWISFKAMYGSQHIPQNDRMAEALTGIYTNIIVNESFDVDDKLAAGLVWENLLPGLRLGASYDNTRLTINEVWVEDLLDFRKAGEKSYAIYDKLANWVFSLEYSWDNLMLMGEFIQTYKEFTLKGFGDFETEPYGWYAGITYRFADWFELGGYYSEYQNDYPDLVTMPPDFYNELKDICLTARFDFGSNWILKFEGHSFDGAYGLSSFDNENKAEIPSDYEYFEKEWTLFAAKLTISF